MHRTLLFLVLSLAGPAMLGACVHKVSIQQGNYLEADQVAKVEPGMTRDQVKFLLGTPLADNPFAADRWDYVYFYRNGRTGQVLRREVIVYFENDRVSRIENPQS